jgi:hypothetical protein
MSPQSDPESRTGASPAVDDGASQRSRLEDDRIGPVRPSPALVLTDREVFAEVRRRLALKGFYWE